MSELTKLTINTDNLQNGGIGTRTVNLGASNMATATTDLCGYNLEVGIGGPLVIDDALSHTSTNPVQNKVVTIALDGKVDEESALTNLEIEALLR